MSRHIIVLLSALVAFLALTASPGARCASLLVVDDDNGACYETYYTSVLSSLGYAYDYWNIYAQGRPSVSQLQLYDCVIWYTANARRPDDWERLYLTQYLDSGGKLFISGQEIGYFDKVDSFYRGYLHSRCVGEVPAFVDITGIDILTGLDISISESGDGAIYARAHDEVIPIAPANGICTYPGRPYWGGVKVDTGVYQVVYLAFGFEAIHTSQMRQSVMSAILNWLIGPPNTQPVEVASISEAKTFANGALLSLPERVVYASLSGAFYIQDPDRSSGIRVACETPPTEGDSVRVTGLIDTLSGERVITGAILTPGSGNREIPRPLGMPNKSVGGSALNADTPGVAYGTGLYNLGLYVLTCGRVVSVNGTVFRIDDGSLSNDGTGRQGMLVDGSLLTMRPAVGDYVVVSGASSCEMIGPDAIRMIRPSKQGDIRIYPVNTP